MTPQEKATEMVYEFINKVSLDLSESRRCAHLAVKNIIRELDKLPECMIVHIYEYWDEVKSKIDKVK